MFEIVKALNLNLKDNRQKVVNNLDLILNNGILKQYITLFAVSLFFNYLLPAMVKFHFLVIRKDIFMIFQKQMKTIKKSSAICHWRFWCTWCTF